MGSAQCDDLEALTNLMKGTIHIDVDMDHYHPWYQGVEVFSCLLISSAPSMENHPELGHQRDQIDVTVELD
jgi:hypothetical protein